MIDEIQISERFQRIDGNLTFNIPGAANDLFCFPLDTERKQVIPKLNRILIEIDYANKNEKKFLSLTEREKEIVKLIVSGYNNPAISERLFISRRTVEQHRKNINRKLEVNSLLGICVFAYAFNLI